MSRKRVRLNEAESRGVTSPPPTDRLRIDIDRGMTGDKVNYPDPAAAPLGTDDEAAGHPVTGQERSMEASARQLSRRVTRQRISIWPYFSGIVAIILMIVALLAA